MSEKFNLKWNDFHSNVSKSFGLLRDESYLQDVTLVSDDFKHFSAHKLVLSACSDYFKNIFQQTKHSQPLLCLEGVSSVDLKNVLDYVYEGEVKILQEDLDKFLAIANRLQLNGLIGGETTEEDQQFEHKEEIECPQPSQTQVQDLPNANLKKNPAVKKQQTIEKRIVAVNENYELQLKQAFDENVETLSNGSLSCKICGKVTTGVCRNGNMKIHLEVHIEGLSYDCKYCDKTFRSKNSLNAHNYSYHKS